MDVIHGLNKWANAHSYYPIDILRVLLGIFLFIKGLTFLSDMHYLLDLAKPFGGYGGVMALIHYIAPAHLVGGVLITFGLLTRWAALAQAPVLLGAILVNFLGEMYLTNLLISSIALVLCLFFMFFGSGKHSADYYFKMRQ